MLPSHLFLPTPALPHQQVAPGISLPAAPTEESTLVVGVSLVCYEMREGISSPHPDFSHSFFFNLLYCIVRLKYIRSKRSCARENPGPLFQEVE